MGKQTRKLCLPQPCTLHYSTTTLLLPDSDFNFVFFFFSRLLRYPFDFSFLFAPVFFIKKLLVLFLTFSTFYGGNSMGLGDGKGKKFVLLGQLMLLLVISLFWRYLHIPRELRNDNGV